MEDGLPTAAALTSLLAVANLQPLAFSATRCVSGSPVDATAAAASTTTLRYTSDADVGDAGGHGEWKLALRDASVVGEVSFNAFAQPAQPASPGTCLSWGGAGSGLAYPSPPSRVVGALPAAVTLWARPNWEVPPTPPVSMGPGPGDGGQVLFLGPRRLTPGQDAAIRFHVYPTSSSETASDDERRTYATASAGLSSGDDRRRN